MKFGQGVELAGKVATAFIPGGSILNELFFDHRSRVKQGRINDFITSFQRFLEEHSLDDIPNEILTSEDFGDLFESVIKRIIQTKSKEKIKRLQAVIFDYVINPVPNEYVDTYLDLIERLNETQIKLLKGHYYLENDYHILSVEWEKKNQEEPTKATEHPIFEGRQADDYNLQFEEYRYLVQDLYSKGLMIEMGIGYGTYRPFEAMAITEFGKNFLDFLENIEVE